MFSTLSQTARRTAQPGESSPLLSTRTITFPPGQSPPTTRSQRQSSYQHKDHRSHSSLQDSNDDSSDDDGEADETEEEDHGNGSPFKDVEQGPVPIFSSDHLDKLPVFTQTHAFREMVVERCDTVLSWDQLRSPQVSQFLVKPILQDIQEHHLNSATHYALIANALQFNKEAGMDAGNSGTDKTRAMLCELIAMKLLREADARVLIDALSYGFDPLQGQSHGTLATNPSHRRSTPRPARISCIEVAIRAGSKRFLAHPLVVQHLQAIWNGTVVFYSAADSMHRKHPISGYGTSQQVNNHTFSQTTHASSNQRTASLYDPCDASLFKLSRLRVPRYRNILSTISFAILLLLFVAVLQEKALEITTLEVVFWIWTAGYMLDEVINFNEQGLSLYIASFWNTFDLGIVLLLFSHLCLRIYGVMLPDSSGNKHHIAKLAYDLLAATSVLLFPRLFSVLDHYRYFSQLIIAFRMMAADMIAIFLLIIIFCSGFLVALTFAFSTGSDTDNPRNVAYALLQMLLGFTPAAWDRWSEYNWLGRTILITFLFVCHFVVVTILITVMTNSFMEIVRNANDEHQYLFAINVISSVKSDALFAYVPPTNVLQWALTPLKFVLPFREYLKLNRYIIKITHLPILWTIYLYERLVLQPKYIDTIDPPVSSRRRVRKTFTERLPRLTREPSIATFRQVAALDEVFKHTTLRKTRNQDRRKSSNVVSSWMIKLDDEDAHSLHEAENEHYKIVDKIERQRSGSRRFASSRVRDFSVSQRPTSVASDPMDLTSHADFFSPSIHALPPAGPTPSATDMQSQYTDAGAETELLMDDNDSDNDTSGLLVASLGPAQSRGSPQGVVSKDYFASKTLPQVHSPDHYDSTDLAASKRGGHVSLVGRTDNRIAHARNVSSATMIYSPKLHPGEEAPALPRNLLPHKTSGPATTVNSSEQSTRPSQRKSLKKTQPQVQPRPWLLSKDSPAFNSTPDIGSHLTRSRPSQIPNVDGQRRRASLEMDLVSDIGDNKAIGGGYVGAVPASFASQMMHANNAMRQSQLQMRQAEENRRKEDSDMFGRLMMARMNTLEEGFREVVHEVRQGMKQVGSGLASRQRSPERDSVGAVHTPKRPLKRAKERKDLNAITSEAASTADSSKDSVSPRTTVDSELGNQRGRTVLDNLDEPTRALSTNLSRETMREIVETPVQQQLGGGREASKADDDNGTGTERPTTAEKINADEKPLQ